MDWSIRCIYPIASIIIIQKTLARFVSQLQMIQISQTDHNIYVTKGNNDTKVHKLSISFRRFMFIAVFIIDPCNIIVQKTIHASHFVVIIG